MSCATGEFRNVLPSSGNADDAKQYNKQAVGPAKKMVIVDEEAAVEAIFFLK